MSAEQVFGFAMQIAIVCWVLLAASLFVPRLRPGTQWVGVTGLPVLIGLVYLYAMATGYGTTQGSFDSLAGVREMFSSDWILLAGWVHYLVFDYFVGAWVVRDSQSKGLNGLLVLPCLFFCLMVGPLGLLLYLGLRGGQRLTARAA